MISDKEFNDAQERLVSAWHRGDVAGAFSEIERILREGTGEMKSQSLFYRGMIQEDQGKITEAQQDWLKAHEYAKEGTFIRYELEHKIGESLERLNQNGEALNWYRRALNTCAGGNNFSGHQTLTSLLNLNGGDLSTEDPSLLASVIEKSWLVLELAGKPDLENLPESIRILNTKFHEIVAEAKLSS